MLNFFYRSVAKSEMNLLAIKNRIDIYLKKGNERNVLAIVTNIIVKTA